MYKLIPPHMAVTNILFCLFVVVFSFDLIFFFFFQEKKMNMYLPKNESLQNFPILQYRCSITRLIQTVIKKTCHIVLIQKLCAAGKKQTLY